MSGLDKRLSKRVAKNGFGGRPVGNPLTALQQLQEAALAAQGLQEVMEQAKALVGELQRAREGMVEATLAMNDLSYEMSKQRAVFMRFLYSPGCMLSPGPLGVAQFLETEERFRVEFDGMQLLLQTLSFLPEGS